MHSFSALISIAFIHTSTIKVPTKLMFWLFDLYNKRVLAAINCASDLAWGCFLASIISIIYVKSSLYWAHKYSCVTAYSTLLYLINFDFLLDLRPKISTYSALVDRKMIFPTMIVNSCLMSILFKWLHLIILRINFIYNEIAWTTVAGLPWCTQYNYAHLH